MPDEGPPQKKAKIGDGSHEESAEADAAGAEDAAAASNGPAEELECDAQPITGALLKKPVEFNTEDTTLNVLPSTTGNLLTTLSKGGFQYLLAGARANVGIKTGRYMYEAKIIEFVTPAEEMARGRPAPVKHFLRLGFSTSQAPLIMGESEHSVAFNSEGQLEIGKKRVQVSQRFERFHVVAVLLNLDEKSPNNNTISLFKDGIRASKPMPLPDALRGKTLFPSVTFKNLAVHVNFGPVLLAPLPFTCHMIGQAAAKDVEVAKAAPAPKGGKHEVIYPVSLPDQGSFDWLDMFLEKNPGYAEISDRAVLAWAESSGIYRSRGYSRSARTCNDAPDMGFGVPSLDDASIKTLMLQVAPVQRRNFVIMEVKGNLTKECRLASLEQFPSARFKRVAVVLLGTPDATFVNRVQALILKAKQEASDRVFEAKKIEATRKRLMERRQRALERERARIMKAREEAQKEAMAKRDVAIAAAAKDSEGQGTDEEKPATPEGDEPGEEPSEEQKAAEEKKADDEKAENENAETEKAQEETKAEEEHVEKEEEGEDSTPPPTVTLTPEEQQQTFRNVDVPDLKEFVLNTSFPSFTLPDKEEGFEELRYEWSKGHQCSQLMEKWIAEKKRTVRIDTLIPGQWFRDQAGEWQKVVSHWKIKQNEAKVADMRKMKEAAEKAAARAFAKAARERAKAEAAAKEEEKAEKAEKEEGEAETKMEVDGETKEEVQEEEPEEQAVDFDSMDIFAVEDVCDVGNGAPLFKEWKVENWALMQLRFEFHVLVCAFERDVEDPERRGMHLDNVLYYYTKYFRKVLDLRAYGVDSLLDLLHMLLPVVYVAEENTLQTYLPAEQETFSVFVKIEEEERRHRTILVDSGDDSAMLKFRPQGLAGHNAAAAAALALASQKRPHGAAPLQAPMGSAGRGPRGQAAPPLQMPPRQQMTSITSSVRMAAATAFGGKGASGRPSSPVSGASPRPVGRVNSTGSSPAVVPGLRVAPATSGGVVTRPPVPARVTLAGGRTIFPGAGAGAGAGAAGRPGHVPSVVRPPPKHGAKPPLESPRT